MSLFNSSVNTTMETNNIKNTSTSVKMKNNEPHKNEFVPWEYIGGITSEIRIKPVKIHSTNDKGENVIYTKYISMN